MALQKDQIVHEPEVEKKEQKKLPKKFVTGLLIGIRGIAVIVAISILAISTTKTTAEPESYGYVGVGVVEAEDSSGTGSIQTQETEFTQSSQPASDKSINVHAVANTPCRIFVVALRKKDSQLAHGWRPEITPLSEWEEGKLPKSSSPWKWSQREGAFDIHVVIFSPKSKSLTLLEKLLSAMEKHSQDPQSSSLQARRLSELINEWSGGRTHLASDIKTEYAGLGGVERGQEIHSFQWRQFAKKIIFTPDQPGVLTYSWTTK